MGRTGESPRNRLAAAIRDQFAVAKIIGWRGHPGLLEQCDGAIVARQTVKVRAEMTGERFQAIEAAGRLERLGIEFDGGVSGEHPGRAAGTLLGAPLVGSAV